MSIEIKVIVDGVEFEFVPKPKPSEGTTPDVELSPQVEIPA